MKKFTLILTLTTLIFLSACSTQTVQPTQTTPVTNPITGTLPATTTTIKDTTALNSYTLADLSTHKTASDCWTTIGTKVYNLTSFFGKHKGGDDKLLLLCGKEGTTLFEGKHGENEKAKAMLQTLIIGNLK